MPPRLVDTTEEPKAETPAAISMEDLTEAFGRFEQALETSGRPVAIEPRVVIKRAMPDREILAAMSGLGAVLAVRLMLALAAVGAFFLAWQAMSQPSIMGICVLVAYAVTTVVPLTYLSTKRT